MKKIIINALLCMFLCLTGRVYGQEYLAPIQIPPAPGAAKIAQFNITPTNLYTGTHNLSIPLYSIPLDGVTIPLSISYHSGGIKASENSGVTGLGWALNVGGIISRTVQGYNDLANKAGHMIGYVHDPNPVPTAFNAVPSGDNWVIDDPAWNYWSSGRRDSQPDIFTYNFLGSAGKFVLSKKNVNNDVEVIKLEENADIIEFDLLNDKFTVVTPLGYIGIFDVLEYTTVASGYSCNTGADTGCDPQCIDMLQIINDGKRAITSWKLSEVVSPMGNKIKYEYALNNDGFSDYMTISSKSFDEVNSVRSSYNDGDPFSQSCSMVINEHLYLTRIYSDDTEINVDFNYSDRDDIKKLDIWLNNFQGERNNKLPDPEKARKLTSIVISNDFAGSSLDNEIKFYQTYFRSDKLGALDQEDYLRLKLDGVQVNDQLYQFEYAEGVEGLPHKSTRGVDYWGFYNGKDFNQRISPVIGNLQPIEQVAGDDFSFWENPNFYYQTENRKANFSYGSAGILTKVIYPTGGYSQYNYESNTYKLVGDEYNVPSGTVTKSASGLVDESIETFEYSGQTSAGGNCSSPLVITLRVQCKDFFLGNSCEVDPADMQKTAVEILKPDNTVLTSLNYQFLWASNSNNYEQTFNFDSQPEGVYTIKTYHEKDGTDPGAETKYYGSATVNYSRACLPTDVDPIISISKTQVAGGARIREILNFDTDGTLLAKRSFEYVNPLDSELLSSGKLMTPLAHVYKEQIVKDVNDDGTPDTEYHYITKSLNALPGTYSAQGNHIGYSVVRENFVGTDDTENGYKYHYYFNAPNTFTETGAAIVNSYNHVNGEKEKEEIFDKDDVEKQNTTYNDLHEELPNPVSSIVFERFNFFQEYGLSGHGHVFNTNITYITHEEIKRNFNRVKEITTTQVLPEGQLAVTQNFEYNSNFQLIESSTTNSNGEVIKTKTRYPHDIASASTTVQAMKDQNVLLPIEEISLVDNVVVSAAATKFKLVNGIIVPDTSYQYNLDLGSHTITSNGHGFSSTYEPVISFNKYDNEGNLQEYQSRNGVPVTVIYGYGGNYPVIQIEGVTKQDLIDNNLSTSFVLGIAETDYTSFKDAFPDAFVSGYQYDPGVGIIK
ncbi:MAG: hypothetical protein AAFQ94_16010, partial [Bacteroidota bacterium]